MFCVLWWLQVCLSESCLCLKPFYPPISLPRTCNTLVTRWYCGLDLCIPSIPLISLPRPLHHPVGTGCPLVPSIPYNSAPVRSLLMLVRCCVFKFVCSNIDLYRLPNVLLKFLFLFSIVFLVLPSRLIFSCTFDFNLHRLRLFRLELAKLSYAPVSLVLLYLPEE